MRKLMPGNERRPDEYARSPTSHLLRNKFASDFHRLTITSYTAFEYLLAGGGVRTNFFIRRGLTGSRSTLTRRFPSARDRLIGSFGRGGRPYAGVPKLLVAKTSIEIEKKHRGL